MKTEMEENLQNINGNTKRESPKILDAHKKITEIKPCLKFIKLLLPFLKYDFIIA